MIPSIRKKMQVQQKEVSADKSPSSSSKRPSEIKTSRSVSIGQLIGRSPSYVSGKFSAGTKRSVQTGGSVFDHIFMNRSLGVREWIVVLVEMFVTYSGQIVKSRKTTPEEALRLWKTRRELDIGLLFVQGWAAIGSMVAGIIGDCYIGPYGLALGGIWVNFVTTSILYVEEIVRHRIKFNPYSEIVSNITTIAFIIIKSTEFSRMVFGLENLRTRKRSTVVLFLFIILIVGDKPKSGGLLMILASYLNFANMTQLRVSFCCTGISLILFHNVPRSKEFSYIGRKVVQCIFVSALRLFKSPSSKRHWMNASGFRCDRHTENAMKELLILFLMIVPTVGFTFFIMGKWAEGNLWEGIATKAYPSGFYKYTGIVAGLQISIYVSMILSFFALVPLLELVGVKKKFSHQFVAGYLIGLFTFWYMTGLVRIYEPPGSLPGVGNVRIINTLKYDAHFITGDLIVSERNFTIKPLGVIMLSYSVNERVLVKTRLAIHEMNNEFNTFLDIAPKKCSAYVLVDPLELLRIKGSIPIWRGVPDANDHTMARLYVFTAARSIVSDARLIFKCLDTNRVVKKNPLVPGDSFVFEVPPGSYEARLERTHVVQTLDVAPGSVYGLIFYSDYHSERLVVDEVIPGKETPGMLSTGFALGYGISFSLAYISFAYMAFLRAPIGLLTTTFGYLAFQENLSNWILLIGFNTWHEQMTSHVMMMYAFLLSFLFFVCIFVFMKYTNVYSVYISCFH